MKTYLVVIEKAAKNFGAFSPDAPGCVVTGATMDETLSQFREALRSHFELMVEYDEDIPEPQPIEVHLAAYRVEGVELNSPEFVLAFIPVEDVMPHSFIH